MSYFDKYVNPSTAGFHVHYLVATLSGSKKYMLNDQQTTVITAHLIVALKTETSEFTDTTLLSQEAQKLCLWKKTVINSLEILSLIQYHKPKVTRSTQKA